MAQLLFFGEYRPDVTDYAGQYTQTTINVVPRADGYGPVRAFAPWTPSSFPSPCRGLFVARRSDGNVFIFGATDDQLFVLNNVDYTWSDVSRTAPYATLPAADNWQFVQYNNLVIAVNVNNPPQVYDLNAGGLFTDLAGNPPQAGAIAVVKTFVVLGRLQGAPFRIHWSAVGNPTGWTPGTNLSDVEDLPDGGPVHALVGGENLFVFQEQKVRRYVFVPGSDVVFQGETFLDDVGTVSPYSITAGGGSIFWYSLRGFMQLAGTETSQIGLEKVNVTFWKDVDLNKFQLFMAASDPRRHLVAWAYKSNAGMSGAFDRVLVYHWGLQRWSLWRISGTYIAPVLQPGLTLEGLDALGTSLDALPFSFDDLRAADTPQLAFVDANGKLGFLTGSEMEAVMETSEASGQGKRMYVNGVRPVTDASAAYVSLRTRPDLRTPPVFTAEAGMNIDGYCPLLGEGRFYRIRVRIPAGIPWEYAAGVEPDTFPVGAY